MFPEEVKILKLKVHFNNTYSGLFVTVTFTLIRVPKKSLDLYCKRYNLSKHAKEKKKKKINFEPLNPLCTEYKIQRIKKSVLKCNILCSAGYKIFRKVISRYYEVTKLF